MAESEGGAALPAGSRVEPAAGGRAPSSAYAGRVPIGTKLAYSVGAAAETTINVAFNAFNFFFYVNVMGVPGTLAGLAITIALIFDAVTDPLVGSLSDRWRSKLGRRHPFMFAAPVPVMLCLFLIYDPPDWGSTGLFLWLTVLTITLRSTMTLYHVPHLALGAELSADFTERTRVMSMNTLFGFFGGLGAAYVGYTYFFAATAEYDNGLLVRHNYPVFATVMALVGGAVMVFSTLATRNVIPRLRKTPDSLPKISLMEFVRDMKLAMSNRNYLMLLLGFLLLSATTGTRETVHLHANTYFWELVPAQIRYFTLIGILGPILGFLVAAPLHDRFDKKRTLIAFLIAYPIFAAGPVVLRMLGLFPANDSPLLMPALLIFYLLQMAGGLMLLITAASALADIADEQELLTGRRQEGIFYSARSFFGKAASGFGHLIAGIAIDLIAFPVGAAPGTVPAETIFKLGLIDGPIAVIPGIVAIGFYLQYRLTRERHAEIQAELAARASQGESALAAGG
jgi:Na+/melibiose symporter-like transporter